MNGTSDNKVCPHCAETIKAAAKVCPHCRYSQKRWSLYNPQFAASLFLVMGFIFMAGFGIFMNRLFEPKVQFADYRDQVSVVSSQFSHRGDQTNLMNTVVGTLTNRTGITWKEIGMEAQFMDKSGRQIDAITAKSDDYAGLVALPHGEVAFKIEGRAARPESDYDSYKVFVRWAKEAEAWP